MRSFVLVASSVVTLALVVGCSTESFDSAAKPTGPDIGGGDAGSAADAPDAKDANDAAVTTDAGPDVSLPPSCDGKKLPSEDACVIDEAAGVFVSAKDGTSVGDGTRSKPLSTIGAGIALAKSASKRVYVCDGSYAESITLANGVSLFGGFDCTTWAWKANARVNVVSPISPALRADAIAKDTRVEGFNVSAPAGNASTPSSIGFVATTSPGVRFVHGAINAGAGFAGATGVDGVQLSNGPWINGDDNLQDSVCFGVSLTVCKISHASRSGGMNQCVGKAVVGGQGGDGGDGGVFIDNGFQWSTSTSAGAGGPIVATSTTGAGGTGTSAPQIGTPGAFGSSGANGVALGTISTAGYVVSNGSDALDGAPGQGGGGGAGVGIPNARLPSYPQGTTVYGIPGSGGGAGGCPGLAGTAGKGGGASIALIASDSPMTFDDAPITAASGGAAGAAGISTAGTAGGSGGAQTTSSQVSWTNYLGGHGGSGGNAGLSGQGGGGPSIGYAVHGTAPTFLASTITNGAGGTGAPAKSAPAGAIPASPTGFAGVTTAF